MSETASDNKQFWLDYETALKTHDWYYARSDDRAKYAAGDAERTQIMNMKRRLSEIDTERAERLYRQYWV